MNNHRTLVRLRHGDAGCAAPCRCCGRGVAWRATGIGTSPGAVAPDDAVEVAIPGGKSLDTVRPGHHEPVDRPIGECLVIDVADRTAGTTTIVRLLITIHRVR